jgi:formylglycine-generating enzyme required for sulfatase activity
MAVAKSGAAPAALSSPTLGKLVGIPPGSFLRDGAPGQRTVISRGYYLMESEVTQGMWRAVMGSQPSYFKDCGPTCPVEQVSWEDAVAFAERVSSKEGVRYRLPTEAEWEHAARGWQLGEYAGAADLGAVGWYKENSGGKTHPVCQKQRNGYGLCDMSGNVREWVSDWSDAYPAGSVTDPAGPSGGSNRVNRGGSWSNVPASARVATRLSTAPGDSGNLLGFRLARSGP